MVGQFVISVSEYEFIFIIGFWGVCSQTRTAINIKLLYLFIFVVGGENIPRSITDIIGRNRVFVLFFDGFLDSVSTAVILVGD